MATGKNAPERRSVGVLAPSMMAAMSAADKLTSKGCTARLWLPGGKTVTAAEIILRTWTTTNQDMQTPESPRSASVNIRRKIFEFIINQKAWHGCLPSREELRKLFGGMTADVDLHLEQLAREGHLLIDRNGLGEIALVPTYIPPQEISVLSRTAHQLNQSQDGARSGSIALDLRGIGVPMAPGMSAVQIFDDRMVDAGIEYGDIALLVQRTPMRGDIVAVEEAEVMVLRRYLIVSGIPHFLAENPSSPDLRSGWDTTMHGVLWGLIRITSRWVASQTPPVRHRVSYSGAKLCDTLSAPQPIDPDAKRFKAAGQRRKQNSKNGNTKATGPITLPRPPFDVQLNESEGGFRLTEQLSTYDTWGHPGSKGTSSNLQGQQPT